MSRKIVAAEPLKKKTLEVDEAGISWSESAGLGSGTPRRYAFDQIDAVVESEESPVLSIQAGAVVHSIPYKKSDETHLAVIAEIVAGARRSAGRA